MTKCHLDRVSDVLLVGSLLLTAGPLGCSTEDKLLLVDLKTDMVPGVEFTTVRLVIEGSKDLDPVVETQIDPAADFIAGQRVAETPLPSGNVRFRLQLHRQRGILVAERPVVLTHDGTQVVTIVMTRDCTAVECPGAEDDPSAEACLGGECVDARCTEETPEHCTLSDPCNADTDCPETASCATAQCMTNGACLLAGSPTACGAEAYCDPLVGCVARDGDGGMVGDAGAPIDAASDASMPPIDAATMDGGVMDGAMVTCGEGMLPYRGTCLDDRPRLGSLAIMPGILAEPFDPEVFQYQASVHPLDDHVSMVAEPLAGETIRVDGVVVSPGVPSAPVPIALGGTLVTVEVEAESGRLAFYDVEVTRAAEHYVKQAATTSNFGKSVALSADGTTLASSTASDTAVFSYGTGGYTEMAVIALGGALSLSGDGTVLAVGSVVARRGTGDFADQTTLAPMDGEAGDGLGASVALSADGTVLVIGAPTEDGNGSARTDNSVADSGAAYVFRWNGTTWVDEAYLKHPNPDISDGFGRAVAISADGSTVAVAAPGDDSNGTTPADDSLQDSGAVFVYRNGEGGTWMPDAFLEPGAPGMSDAFGDCVSLSQDGMRIAVGAALEDGDGTAASNDALPDSGAVYVFDRAGVWSESAYVKATNLDQDDRFGSACAMTADGTALMVGSAYESSDGSSADDDSVYESGAAYLFREETGTFRQVAYLKASATDPFDYLGESVALSANGSTTAAGAPYEDGDGQGDTINNFADGRGAVFAWR